MGIKTLTFFSFQHVCSKVGTPGGRVRTGRLLLLLAALAQATPPAVQSVFFAHAVGSTPIERVLGDLFSASAL